MYQTKLRHDPLRKDILLGTFDSFPEKYVNVISTRQGGVSQKPYDSLNLGLHVGDEIEDVIENRIRFFTAINEVFRTRLKIDDLATPEQIHGDRIVVVTDEHRGRGAFRYIDSIPQTDALITREKNLPLMLCFADCVPVLFCDPVHEAVGIAHAGYKGTELKIAAKTLQEMQDKFETDPAECLIAIAPSIGVCCYTRDNQPMDLWKMNREQLIDAGVPESNIDVSNVCTKCNVDNYFSYRVENKTGRIAAVIVINERKKS